MIIQAAKEEGALWVECHPEDLDGVKVAAVQYGKWIYDFKLKELGYNPIRHNPRDKHD